VIGTTTDMFFKKTKAAFRAAPRPVPNVVSLSVPRDGGSIVMSSPDGLRPVAVPAPAPMLATQTRFTGQAWVSPAPPRPLVETIGLGPRAAAVSTPGFDMMGTEEEKIGPRAKPASLVGGL